MKLMWLLRLPQNQRRLQFVVDKGHALSAAYATRPPNPKPQTPAPWAPSPRNPENILFETRRDELRGAHPKPRIRSRAFCATCALPWTPSWRPSFWPWKWCRTGTFFPSAAQERGACLLGCEAFGLSHSASEDTKPRTLQEAREDMESSLADLRCVPLVESFLPPTNRRHVGGHLATGPPAWVRRSRARASAG